MQTSALPTNLPSQLLQALDDLGVAPQGRDGAPGGDFWTRLAAQLEQLEAVAAALPEDVSVEDLTPLLAAELGGDGLPEDGSALPLPPGLGLESDLLQPDSIAGGEGTHPLELLAAALHAAAAGRPAAAGEGTGDDLAALRARLGEMLAGLQGGSAAPPVDARPAAAAPFSLLPGVVTGGPGTETAAGPLPGFSALFADARLPDAALAAGLPGAGAGDAASMRGLLEARLADAGPQAASTAGITTAPGDAATGSQPGSASAPGARIFHVDVPLQQPGWDRALGNGIRWMVNQNLQAAELKLSPPHLGPLEVRLQVDGDRTHLNIIAPQATTREAVEAALPRLREMFAESGLNLGDVNVSEDGRERGGTDGSRGHGAQLPGTADGSAGEADAGATRSGPPAVQGLVDYYA
ncbi:flagellar hook-length control protein FliK [Thioalkalivibrio sp.]|uniref:flagellar hook-length control protein FliK n=1 Tax=Thioalkalivibrio sp. TaxID=2093813 RepID=UPI0035675A60